MVLGRACTNQWGNRGATSPASKKGGFPPGWSLFVIECVLQDLFDIDQECSRIFYLL